MVRFCWVVAIVTVACAAPSFAADVSTFEELRAYFGNASAGATYFEKLPAVHVNVVADLNFTETLFLYSGANITITSTTGATLSGDGKYQLFNVYGQLTLRDLVLEHGVTGGAACSGWLLGDCTGGIAFIGPYGPTRESGGLLTAVRCIFRDSASWAGGALMVYAGRAVLEASTFYGLSGVYGGAIHVHAGAVEMRDCEFRNNTAELGGGVLQMMSDAYAAWLDIRDSKFTHNHAKSNGGVFEVTPGSTFRMVRLTMAHNTAAEYGGAVYIRQSSGSFENCRVDHNTALGNDGGAFYFALAVVDVVDTSFTGNAAEDNGGGMVLTEAATGAFRGCRFADTFGKHRGGTFFVDGGSTLALTNCTSIDDVSMLFGGFLYVLGAVVRLVDVHIINAQADSGAAIEAAADGLFVAERCVFENVTSGYASAATTGALYARATAPDYAIALIDVQFRGQLATAPITSNGGRVSVLNSPDLGLALADLGAQTVAPCADLGETCPADMCTDASIGAECYCAMGGVTVSAADCAYTAELAIRVPFKRTFEVVVTKPATADAELVLENFGAADMVWAIAAGDWDASPASGTIAAGGLEVVSVSRATALLQSRGDPYADNLTFASASPCACRAQELVVQSGLYLGATLDHALSNISLASESASLAVSGTAGFYVASTDTTGRVISGASALLFSAALSAPNGARMSACEVFFDTERDIHEGSCALPELVAGEFTITVTEQGTVVDAPLRFYVGTCPAGYYLEETRDECVACVRGQDCALPGSTLGALAMARGYWRADERSTVAYACRLDGACAGGNATSAALCTAGYIGAACGSCDYPTHYLSVVDQTCNVCSPGAKGLALGVTITIVVVLAGLFLRASYYADRKMLQVKATKLYRLMSPSRIKVLWTLFQIITSIEATLKITYPQPYGGVLNLLASLQLDISVLPVSCVTKFSFYQKLIFSTITPIVIVSAIAIGYFVRVRYATGAAAKHKVFALHSKGMLLVSYLAYVPTRPARKQRDAPSLSVFGVCARVPCSAGTPRPRPRSWRCSDRANSSSTRRRSWPPIRSRSAAPRHTAASCCTQAS